MEFETGNRDDAAADETAALDQGIVDDGNGAPPPERYDGDGTRMDRGPIWPIGNE